MSVEKARRKLVVKLLNVRLGLAAMKGAEQG